MTEARQRLVLTAALTVLVASAATSAMALGPAARRLPLVVALATLALLVLELRRQARPADVASDEGEQAVGRLEAATFAWLGGLLASVWLLGMLAGLPLFLGLYLRLRSREPWAVALGMAAGVWLVLFGVLSHGLGMQMHGGVLGSLLDSRRP